MLSSFFGPSAPPTPPTNEKKLLVTTSSVPPTPSTASGSASSYYYSSGSTPTTASSSSSASGLSEGSGETALGTTTNNTTEKGPSVKYPYRIDRALDDIPGLQYALKLFLESKMVESEEYCHQSDEKKERLYFATGFSLIQCVKGLMSYEDEDLLAALNHARHGNHIASQHRKKQALLGSIVSVIHSSSSVSWIKSMTDVERHAELVYAESLFERALLGIVYSGDWLAFIKEALNMRTTISIYKSLLSYIDTSDALHSSLGLGPTDPSIDPHFRSGVYLGNGMANIVLSLMPGKLLTVVEMFGYHGEREVGLELLMRAGGWGDGTSDPTTTSPTSPTTEGLRRPICDLCLLMFHLVISSFTFTGVDIQLASKILEYNLERYPDSVFFLFGAGRLGLIRGQPHEAIQHYKKAMRVQSQYKSLHHVSWWEIAVAELALGRVGGGSVAPRRPSGSSKPQRGKGGERQEETGEQVKEKDKEDREEGEEEQDEQEEQGSGLWWRKMHNEATWSRAIYGYGLAVCLYEESLLEPDEERKNALREEAGELMRRVPELRQRIAGKSIPLEKLVSRKSRKFTSQSHLTLPALELSYLFQALSHSPLSILLSHFLPVIHSTLQTLLEYKEHKREREYEKEVLGGERGFYDDFCLGRFLEGVCARYVVWPEENIVRESGVGAGDGAGAVSAPSGGASAHDVDGGLGKQGQGQGKEEKGKQGGKVGGKERKEWEEQAERAFRDVFEYGPKIELDHWVVYHAHYELGRLLACQGKHAEAKREFELVLSGKYLEVGASGRKGKYSLENALHVRTHAANEALKAGKRL